jgi:fatty acid CoA ligase FadD9
LRPNLKERYGAHLERMYHEIAAAQVDEITLLRESAAVWPVIDTVTRAAQVVLGTVEIDADAPFTELGGDSLSALTFSNLLHEILGIEVPVSAIINPASDLRRLAAFIESARSPGVTPLSPETVHGKGATRLRASDLTLDKFIDATTLAGAPTLPPAASEPATILLTGANGWLGRFLTLELLQRVSTRGGKLIAITRARTADGARARLAKVFDSGDEALQRRFLDLAVDHLEVLPGDIGEHRLGLHPVTWSRLAKTVDAIVHPAALVNHVLSYNQLFGPNVGGTAELIRLAMTTQIKPVSYLSTIAVASGIAPAAFVEDGDIRLMSPVRPVDQTYANGYSNSKWAGEVLLREAHDLCGLPVTVFRSDMIMAHSRYVGQLNVSDMLSRLILSLIVTGIAPQSFYECDGARPRAHYDGLPVEFVAEAVTAIGQQVIDGFRSFNVLNPHDDGVSLDVFVDWLIVGGHEITRIADYHDWLARFQAALTALPEPLRAQTIFPLLHAYREPERPIRAGIASAEAFHAAVRVAGVGPGNGIPHVSSALIDKYAADLRRLGLVGNSAHNC